MKQLKRRVDFLEEKKKTFFYFANKNYFFTFAPPNSSRLSGVEKDKTAGTN